MTDSLMTLDGGPVGTVWAPAGWALIGLLYVAVGALMALVIATMFVKDSVWSLRKGFYTAGEFVWEVLADIGVALLAGALWPITFLLWVLLSVPSRR